MNSIMNNAWATVFKKPQTNNIVNGIVKITSRSLRVVLLLKKDRVATVSHNSNIDTVTHGTESFTEIVVHFPIKSIRR